MKTNNIQDKNVLRGILDKLTVDEISVLITPFAAYSKVSSLKGQNPKIRRGLQEAMHLHREIMAELNEPLKWMDVWLNEYDSYDDYIKAMDTKTVFPNFPDL